MSEELKPEIAASLDGRPELLPYIPELLKDFWSLGSLPELLIGALRPLQKASSGTVIDFGCGKGAISIQLAKNFGFHVLGIDAFEPFIIEARQKASEYNVSHLCRFITGDIKIHIDEVEPADLVIYSAIGYLLGNLENTVEKLRKCVKPGGYLVIDDGFLDDSVSVAPQHYENCPNHAEALRQLRAHGDSLIYEYVYPQSEIVAMNRHDLLLIRNRAEQLSKKYPDRQELFREYVKMQEMETEILNTKITSAFWIIKRAK